MIFSLIANLDSKHHRRWAVIEAGSKEAALRAYEQHWAYQDVQLLFKGKGNPYLYCDGYSIHAIRIKDPNEGIPQWEYREWVERPELAENADYMRSLHIVDYRQLPLIVDRDYFAEVMVFNGCGNLLAVRPLDQKYLELIGDKGVLTLAFPKYNPTFGTIAYYVTRSSTLYPVAP